MTKKIKQFVQILFSVGLFLFLLNLQALYAQTGLVYALNSWEIISPSINNFSNSDSTTYNFDSSISNKKIIPSIRIHKKFTLPDYKFIDSKKNKASGQILSENYVSNIQNPWLRNDLAYSRLNLNLNISALGIPIKIMGFYTSEKNNLYSRSYFRVQYDIETHKQDIKDSYLQEIERYQKNLRLEEVFSEILKQQIENSKKELEEYKRTDLIIPDTNELKNNLKNKLNQKIDSINQANQNNYWADSLKSKSNLNDSLNKYSIKKQKYDSLLTVKDSLENRWTQWYQEYKKDSSTVAELYLKLKSGKIDELISDSLSQNKNKLNVKSFQLGQANLNYNEHTIMGLPLRGIDLKLEKNDFSYGVSLGKSIQPNLFENRSQKPKYEKNLLGLNFSKKNQKSKYGLFVFTSFDDSQVIEPERNSVFSFQLERKIKKNILLNQTVSISDYSKQTIGTMESARSTRILKLNEHLAYSGVVDYQIFKATKINAKYNYFGNYFKTIGNLFLRNAYSEIEIGIDQGLFKNKINTHLFYKQLKNNTNEFSNISDQLSGYGINATSHFEKGPNFFLTISPYQQGNNHPDSLFRTFNQSNLIVGGITYSKNMKRWFMNSTLIYTHSGISGINLPEIKTNILTLENSIQFDGNHEFNISNEWSKTAPNLDSLNFVSHRISYLKIIQQNFTVNFSAFSIKYGNESGVKGVSSGLNYIYKKNTTIIANLNYQKVKNWWGIQGIKNAYSFNLSLMRSF